ncbi:MAG: hypothetical protein EU551_01865 [Promethearchaeota archaeon]|nr:MAG: hypothetical protein EU551_01865 [Candidatus Lokiarchaeota archaeon]
MKKHRYILFFSLIALLLLNFIPYNVNGTPNSGVPIDEITSILWTWNSSSQNNILKLQDYEKSSDYFFSCVLGQDPDLTNNLTVLLSSGSVYWNNFTISSKFTSIDIDDITGDSLPEIVVGTEDDGLIVFNVTSMAIPIWNKPLLKNITSVKIENMSVAPGKEIVVFNDDKLAVYFNNGSLFWEKLLPAGSKVSDDSYCITDLNLDNYLDIIYGGKSELIALNGLNQSIIWNNSLNYNISSIKCADIDNNKIKDILIGSYGNISRFNGSNGHKIWSFTGSIEMSLSADVENILTLECASDIGQEIIFTSVNYTGGAWPIIYKLNSSGELIQSTILGIGDANITNLVAGDINGDGNIELVSADTFGQVITWSCCGDLVWNYTFNSPINSMIMGFVNFDNIPDILVNTNDSFITAIGIPLGTIDYSFFLIGIGVGAGIFVVSMILVFFLIKKIKPIQKNSKNIKN